MSDSTGDASEHYELTVHDAIRFAVAAIQRGGRADGRALLAKVLEIDPNNADAVHFMGVAAFQDEEMETAKALFARALELAPQSPDIWNNFGNVCSELDDAEGALAAYRKAVELAPQAYHVMGNLISVLRITNRLPEALELIETALAGAPDNAMLLNNASNVYCEMGDFQKASLCLARIMDMQKPSRQVTEARALLYMRAGEIDKALAAYAELLADSPGDPEILHQMSALSGKDVPLRASDAYIQKMFDAFSQSFDAQLRRLDYRAPEFVAAALTRAMGVPGGTLDILDAGCGTGLCGPLIRAHARRLVGIDLSEGMLVRARRRNVYDGLEQAELTRYMVDHPRSFDAITCADTLCYFGDLSAVCESASGALREGGAFLFTVEENTIDRQAHRLQTHGRYCHAESHVHQACSSAGLHHVVVERGALRNENGEPVHGLIVSARH